LTHKKQTYCTGETGKSSKRIIKQKQVEGLLMFFSYHTAPADQLNRSASCPSLLPLSNGFCQIQSNSPFSAFYYGITSIIRINWNPEWYGYAENPDNWIFFENWLHRQCKVEQKFLQTAIFRLHIYLRTNKTLIHNSLYVFDNWGKNLSHKKDVVQLR
jgi:hypothetical protein